MLVGILATLQAGAAYVPQDVAIAPAAQLQHIIATASTDVILTLSTVESKIEVPEGCTCVAVDTIMAEPMAESHATFRPARAAGAEDGCYVLFTSGTTGTPNGVTVTHRNVCNILLTEPAVWACAPAGGWVRSSTWPSTWPRVRFSAA